MNSSFKKKNKPNKYLRLSTLASLTSFLFLATPLKVKAQPRKIAILVNGNGDCCVWKMEKTQQAFRDAGIQVYKSPWNSLSMVSGSSSENQATKVSVGATKNFVDQMTSYISSLPEGSEVYLVGHSFGGDSILQFLNSYKRDNVKFKFVGVLDAVGFGGQRSITRNNTVSSNVEYFYNRWQTNAPWPVDIKGSGNISCNAKTCDQEEQSISRHPDGSARKTKCADHEVTCPGYGTDWSRGYPRIRAGEKQTRLHHQQVPTDPLIETQITEIVGKIAKESEPEIVSTRQDVPAGVPNLMIQTEGYPVVAVFSERKESFALGCMEIRNIWGKIPVQAVSSSMYNSIQASNPVVADLPCNGSIRAYAPTGEPGALVIKHRNGVNYRHYINPLDFIAAVKAGDLIPIDVSEFRTTFPDRGTDFQVYR